MEEDDEKTFTTTIYAFVPQFHSVVEAPPDRLFVWNKRDDR
jgi:hypothetical protein